jgi:hypothetical protein
MCSVVIQVKFVPSLSCQTVHVLPRATSMEFSDAGSGQLAHLEPRLNTLIGQWVECVDGLQRKKVPFAAREGCTLSRTIADYADRLVLGNRRGRLTILDFSNCEST